MALVLGTNCGFVTVAPTDDPEALSGVTADAVSRYVKDDAPTGEVKITEIGWWCDNISEEANFEVGIYTDDSATPDAVVGTISRTNAKGTTAGWKKATGLNIEIAEGTTYWIAFQLDATATATSTNYVTNLIGEKYYRSNIGTETTLDDPATFASTVSNYYMAIYAVWEPVITKERIVIKATPNIILKLEDNSITIKTTSQQTLQVINNLKTFKTTPINITIKEVN